MIKTKSSVKTNNNKITDAIELLNEAAKEKRTEIKELMTDRYSHIREAVLEGATQGQKILEKTQDAVQETIDETRETAKKTAKKVDKRIHEDPWPYLSGVAFASLILGWFMSSKRK